MIKLEKKTESTKQAKPMGENRFKQITDAIAEKQKTTGTALTVDRNPTDKKKESYPY